MCQIQLILFSQHVINKKQKSTEIQSQESFHMTSAYLRQKVIVLSEVRSFFIIIAVVVVVVYESLFTPGFIDI